MWENRQQLLSQSLNYQMFLRDAKMGEVALSQQENFLSKVDTPVSAHRRRPPPREGERPGPAGLVDRVSVPPRRPEFSGRLVILRHPPPTLLRPSLRRGS